MIYTKPFEFENAKPHYNKDRNFKLKHIDAHFTFGDITSSESVDGVVTLTLSSFLQNPDHIVLDACDMNIYTVECSGKELEFEYDSKELYISLGDKEQIISIGDEVVISISYRIENPQRGLYFVHPDEDSPEISHQVWSQGESVEASYWMPLYDSPNQICTCKKTITTIKPYAAYSNGLITHSSDDEHTTTVVWEQDKPLPVYLNALFVTDGTLHTLEHEYNFDFEIANIVTKKDLDKIDTPAMNMLPEMIQCLSDLYAVPFPHQKYYQGWISKFIWGGMENTSITFNSSSSLYDEVFQNDVSYQEKLIVHELTHQWFGDLIVINHWSELWIKEGGAVFGEIAWSRYKHGKDESDYYRYGVLESYLQELKRPTQLNYYQATEDLYDKHSYNKAGLVYALIEQYLGNKQLFTLFLHELLTKNAYQNVGYQDVIKAATNATGKNITPLIDQYILRSGHPSCKTSYSWDQGAKLLKLTVKQTQYDPKASHATLFRLPKVPLDIGYVNKSGETEIDRTFISLEKGEQTVFIPCEKKPSFVTIDSDFLYIFEHTYECSQKELHNIALYHTSILARVQAIKQIAKSSTVESVDVLEKLFKNSTNWIIQKEVASALGKIKLDQSRALILSLVNESLDGKVLMELFSSLSSFADLEVYKTLKSYCRSIPHSYVATAQACKSLGKVAAKIGSKTLEAETFTFLLSIFNTIPSHNRYIDRGIIFGMSQLVTCQDAFDFVAQASQKGSEKHYYVRLSAMAHLSHFAKYGSTEFTEKILDLYESYAHETFLVTSMYLIPSLGAIKSKRVIGILDTIEQTTIHYRMKARCQKVKQMVLAGLKKETSNAEVYKKLEKKDKTITKLSSQVQALEAQMKEVTALLKKQSEKSDKKS